MKILIIPDVHLKPWMFNAADEIDKNKYDRIVCLGDLVDDWGQQFNTDLYDRTMQRVLKFDKDHPDMLWCLGNHDFSYLWGHPESGYSSMQGAIVSKYIVKLEDQAGKRLAIVHDVDGMLFSHAGLKNGYLSKYKYFEDSLGNRTQLLNAINCAWKEKKYEEFLWEDGSPIWLRPPGYGETISVPYLYGQTKDEFKEHKICQVVGHTPVKEPKVSCGMLITDTFSTYSDGVTPVGNEKFIIFDTDTRTWEYAH